ncbi:hypothetical protein D3C84_741450 [compost metagenome]
MTMIVIPIAAVMIVATTVTATQVEVMPMAIASITRNTTATVIEAVTGSLSSEKIAARGLRFFLPALHHQALQGRAQAGRNRHRLI